MANVSDGGRCPRRKKGLEPRSRLLRKAGHADETRGRDRDEGIEKREVGWADATRGNGKQGDGSETENRNEALLPERHRDRLPGLPLCCQPQPGLTKMPAPPPPRSGEHCNNQRHRDSE
jgi:hypothetical protein